ncbi:hypothetical protein VTI74DRAFT_1888 [Chaetomium olivicolor]
MYLAHAGLSWWARNVRGPFFSPRSCLAGAGSSCCLVIGAEEQLWKGGWVEGAGVGRANLSHVAHLAICCGKAHVFHCFPQFSAFCIPLCPAPAPASNEGVTAPCPACIARNLEVCNCRAGNKPRSNRITARGAPQQWCGRNCWSTVASQLLHQVSAAPGPPADPLTASSPGSRAPRT